MQHAGDLPDAVVLLLEAGDRHAIFGLQLLVSSEACVHGLTLTDQVLYFKFESAQAFMRVQGFCLFVALNTQHVKINKILKN